MTNENGGSLLTVRQVAQVHWVQGGKETEEAWILNLNFCHVSQFDIFHSSATSGASSFDFLLPCFSPHILHLPDKTINSNWLVLLCHVYRTYIELVVPDSALQRGHWILVDLKMILLESQKSLMFLLMSSECRNTHSASALRQRVGTNLLEKFFFKSCYLTCPKLTHLQ